MNQNNLFCNLNISNDNDINYILSNKILLTNQNYIIATNDIIDNSIIDNVICIDNAIIYIKLNIIPSIKYIFNNCIINEDIIIDSNVKIDLTLNKCICTKNIYISTDCDESSNIVITDSAIDSLEIYGTNIINININRSTLFHISVAHSNINSFIVAESYVHSIQFNESACHYSRTPDSTINIDSLNDYLKTGNLSYLRTKFNLISMHLSFHANSRNNDINYNVLGQTIDVLKTFDSIKYNKQYINKLILIETINNQKGAFHRWLVSEFSGFLDPLKFVYISLLVIFIFGCFYCMPFVQFNINKGLRKLDICEAMYFSGITYTTIGYGDISPSNTTARFASCAEGLAGIIILNCFTIALVRRYIDSK